MCKNPKKFGKKAVLVAVAAILGASILAMSASADITSEMGDKMKDLVWESNEVLQYEYNLLLDKALEDGTVIDHEFCKMIDGGNIRAYEVINSKGVYSVDMYNIEREIVIKNLLLSAYMRSSTDDNPEQLKPDEILIRDQVIHIYEGLEELQPIGEEAIQKQKPLPNSFWNTFGFDPVEYNKINERKKVPDKQEKIEKSTPKPSPQPTQSPKPTQNITYAYGELAAYKNNKEVTHVAFPKPVYLFQNFARWGIYVSDNPRSGENDIDNWLLKGGPYKTYGEVCEICEKGFKEQQIKEFGRYDLGQELCFYETSYFTEENKVDCERKRIIIQSPKPEKIEKYTSKPSPQPAQVVRHAEYGEFVAYGSNFDTCDVDIAQLAFPEPVYLYITTSNQHFISNTSTRSRGYYGGEIDYVRGPYKRCSEVCEGLEKLSKESGNVFFGHIFLFDDPYGYLGEGQMGIVCYRKRIITHTIIQTKKETPSPTKTPVKEASRYDPTPTPVPGFEVPAGLSAAGIAAYFAARYRKKE